MIETSCPHCKEEISADFLKNAEKDKKLACPLCGRSILIDQKKNKLVPLSDSYVDCLIIGEKKDQYRGMH